MKYTSKKTLITVLSVALVVALAIGGTFAYLQSVSDKVVNKFEKSTIGVDIEETTTDYKIIPGGTDAKDPKVTFKSPDVDAYLFVEVTDDTDGLVGWEPNANWTLVTGTTNVYYYNGPEATEGVLPAQAENWFWFLKDNQVSYSPDITLGDMGDLDMTADLAFKAYIIQADPFDNAANAWNGVVKLPVASLTELSADEINALLPEDMQTNGIQDTLTPDSYFYLDTGAEFTLPEDFDAADYADYANWAADFRISFNKDIVDGKKIHLFGNYGEWGWLGDDLATGGIDTLDADTPFRVLGQWFKDGLLQNGQNFNGINFSEVVNNVQDFLCGINVEDGALGDGVSSTGLGVTVELIAIDDAGHIHILNSYTYTYT